jgi:FKBP-type peptidyl-prolyl cis-trans isomerase SlyD
VGTTLHSENEKGERQSFIVTRIDNETLTVDGNNPLCGRMVNFNLEILGVRDAIEEEIEAGGPIDKEADIPDGLKIPLH